MCPLRIILIFLSATLAGFFVLRNINSSETDDETTNLQSSDDDERVNQSSKVGFALKSGFWTCVDMASGRYLWRHLVSANRSD